jgi:hypothetical protein
VTSTVYTSITSLGTKRERQLLDQDIRRALASIPGLTIETRHHDRELLIDAFHPLLRASWWATLGDDGHLIAWHRAERDLVLVPEAWQDVNDIHRRKATSFATTPNDAIGRLVKGFEAAIDGSAFAS